MRGMKKCLIAVVSLAVFAIACAPADTRPEPLGTGSVPHGSTFAWTYAPSDVDGIPHTAIGLDITFPDGTVRAKEIDDIEGGCNEYPEPDADAYAGSAMITCYYAGLGRYYKVVESGGKYLVQRRIFEEASPDYAPPELPFQTVVEL
jgi:hypothetical protein